MARKHLGAIFLLTLCGPAMAATPGVTTIDNPGGGTIAYAQMPQQHTAQGAMGKVLQYAQKALGGRPDIDKVMKSPDGNSLALTFTVGQSGASQIAGLALVAVSASGPGAGAVLSDKADHFRSSLQPMLTRLQQEAVAKGGSAGAQAAIANASSGGSSDAKASDAKPAAKGTPGSSSSSSSATASSPKSASAASGKPPVASAPAAKLVQTPIPDGSGTIGLPAGWTITAAHAGDVSAKGPNGEVLRFGMAQGAIDPNNPQGRALGRGPRGTAPTNFVFIPVGTPGDVAFRSTLAQLAQKRRMPAPNIDFTGVKEVPGGAGNRTWQLAGNLTTPTGPAVTWVELFMSTQVMMGSFEMSIYEITVPQALASQEAASIGPMFSAYKPNNAQIMGQINTDTRIMNQTFANAMRNEQQMMDSSERSTQAVSDYLRGDTVISDSALNAHGRVPDDVANALIQAYPDRFQAVSSGSYVRGIDY
jgi:hypothetical protein